MIYSWQKELWNRLLGQPERIPHALLLSGLAGGGKIVFAQSLAARLLCETAIGLDQACGSCPSCNWLQSGNHPDFRLIEPGSDEPVDGETESEDISAKKKSDQIRIHQIRELDDFLTIGTHRHGRRVIIIRPAEAMNQTTANSILKTLEEPSLTTLFILVTNNKKRLLPTILSRCQVLHFQKPPIPTALEWLRQSDAKHAQQLLAHAGGMPLAAMEEDGHWEQLEVFFNDLSEIEHSGPVAIAGRWESWLKENKNGEAALQRRTLIIWMQKWIFDLVSMKICGGLLFHPHKLMELRTTAERASLNALIDCYNDFLRIRAAAQHPLNLRLFLEDMLSRYARAALSGR
ncbi:MAG: DNA polymerase III subunit delta' [Rhodocyclaceae bacterium]|nr:DNA polymerase III subunit delta' [Rhodocyclaceae bacterium]